MHADSTAVKSEGRPFAHGSLGRGTRDDNTFVLRPSSEPAPEVPSGRSSCTPPPQRWLVLVFLCGLLMPVGGAHAQQRHPEHWSFEMRGGLYNPTSGAMKDFFSGCCNVTAGLTGGWLLQSRFGVDAGASYMSRSGSARGQTTGTTSQEPFSLLLIPATLEGTFRADYHAGQRMVPYAKGGFDLVYFRENNDGRVIKGMKHGVHGGMGLMVLVNDLMESGLDGEYGLNDVFFVLDGRYQWINNFGGAGLDLSGWTVSTGVHMQF